MPVLVLGTGVLAQEPKAGSGPMTGVSSPDSAVVQEPWTSKQCRAGFEGSLQLK